MNSETDEHVLLVGDLAPFEGGGDRFGICTAEQVELAVQQIAKFHATWWESPRLADMENLLCVTPGTCPAISGNLSAALGRLFGKSRTYLAGCP